MKPLTERLKHFNKHYMTLRSILSIVSIVVIIIAITVHYLLSTQTMATNGATDSTPAKANTEHKTIYEFTVKDIDGNDVSLEKYRGFAVIVVNVASNCGFTKTNYKELNQLFDKYEEKGLKILAFPCNQFLNQEPGCDVDIKEFMKKNSVRFDFFGKVDVNGDNAHPLWKWLREQQGGFFGNFIKWNFTKFLVNRSGVAVKRYAPTTSPMKIETDLLAVINDKN